MQNILRDNECKSVEFIKKATSIIGAPVARSPKSNGQFFKILKVLLIFFKKGIFIIFNLLPQMNAFFIYANTKYSA